MKKVLVFMIGLSLLVFALSGVSYGWQGRMGGMGDPYGLIEDESDFLIFPAKIAQGQGIRLYGHYRFTYTGVTDWDYNLDEFTTAGVLDDFNHFDTSGQELKHNVLVGAAFPVIGGRMGLFFTYDGMRGDYDGDEAVMGVSNFAEYDLTKDLDNFALRLLYGLPVGGGMDVGLELGMAYRDETQETWWNAMGAAGSKNFPWSWAVPERSLFPFMIPYDSQYWELLWKTGIKITLATLKMEVTLRGSAIIQSVDDGYEFEWHFPVGTIVENVDMDGDVAGWRIGSDIWMRVPGSNPTVTFPVLVSVDYAKKERDGDGIGTGLLDAGDSYDYTHKEQSLDLKAGGGIEKKLGGNALIAGGIYYNYLQGSDGATFTNTGGGNITADSCEFPSRQEHRAILRLAGEKELIPSTLTLRMGLNFFYGWIQEDFEYKLYWGGVYASTDDVSLDGSHWGIGASLGGTILIPPITLEPFINFGWQQIKLDGDGDRTNAAGTVTTLWEMDKSRDEWSIGGGLSILFDI